eukprot:1747228-Rhodomonas_salina.1
MKRCALALVGAIPGCINVFYVGGAMSPEIENVHVNQCIRLPGYPGYPVPGYYDPGRVYPPGTRGTGSADRGAPCPPGYPGTGIFAAAHGIQFFGTFVPWPSLISTLGAY